MLIHCIIKSFFLFDVEDAMIFHLRDEPRIYPLKLWKITFEDNCEDTVCENFCNNFAKIESCLSNFVKAPGTETILPENSIEGET